MVSKCGCGRPVRYMTRTGDACNKYGRCNPDNLTKVFSQEKPKPTIQELEAKVAELSEMVVEQNRIIEKLRPQASRWALIEEMMFAGNVSLNQDEDG